VVVGGLLSVAAWVFGVPVRGSIASVYFVSSTFLMTSLGLGLLISTVSTTQQQAMLTAFFALFPAMMLSGFIYPISNMPRVVQWITYLNPLRYFVELMRGILVKGAGLWDLWPSVVALIAIGTLVLIAAALTFHKRSA
jgi:ABC-2 type transport system permease protein